MRARASIILQLQAGAGSPRTNFTNLYRVLPAQGCRGGTRSGVALGVLGTPDRPSVPVQVVKVVGSNISHKLRLSRVKLEDEGTYECRVIDSSDGKARHHKVKAYLRVEAAGGPGHPQDTELREAPLAELAVPGSAHAHHHHHHHKAGKELKKRSADTSCVL